MVSKIEVKGSLKLKNENLTRLLPFLRILGITLRIVKKNNVKITIKKTLKSPVSQGMAGSLTQ